MCKFYLVYLIHVVICILYWIYPDELYYLGWISPDGTLVIVTKMTLGWIRAIFPDEKLDISDISKGTEQEASKEVNYFVQICYYIYGALVESVTTMNIYKIISVFELTKSIIIQLLWRKTTIIWLTILLLSLFVDEEWRPRLYWTALVIFISRTLYGFYSAIPQEWIDESKSRLASSWKLLVTDRDIVNSIKKIKFIVPIIQLCMYYYFLFRIYKKYKDTEICSGTCGFFRYELIYSAIMTGVTMITFGMVKEIVRVFFPSGLEGFYGTLNTHIGLIGAGAIILIFGLILLPRNIKSECTLNE